MQYWQNGMDVAGGFVMLAGVLALWALAAVAIIVAVRSPGYPTGIVPRAQQSPTGDAGGIRAGRFARGEIDPGEYRTMLVLGSRSTS